MQISGSSCSGSLSLCGDLPDSQANWLITQFINTTGTGIKLNSVIIIATLLAERECNHIDCLVEIYAIQTNEINQRTIVGNITQFIHSSYTTKVTPRNAFVPGVFIKVVKLQKFTSGLYIALNYNGSMTCFKLAELRVYSPVCDILDLVLGAVFLNRSYPGEISNGSCLPNMGIDSNAPNRTFQALCFGGGPGTWEIIENTTHATQCTCLPGYKFISRSTVNQCQGV